MKITMSFLIPLVLFVSCNTKKEEAREPNGPERELFTVLTSEDTGIDFRNELKENTYMNGLFYEYYYNGGGVAVADYNNDGLKDIYFVNSLASNKLYLNKGNMQFEDITEISNAGGGYGFGTGVTLVDINNDGLMDIYYCKSGKIKDPDKRRNELLINKGVNAQGIPVFENQAAEYGLDIPDFSTQAVFFDYDKDDDLDMFLINHGIELYDENTIEELLHQRSEYRGERLYQNNNGKFVDVSAKAGIINNMLGFGLGIAIGDLNTDGWPDIYVGNDFSEKDHLYINNQDGTFRETSLQSFGHVSNFSMGNDIADLNNDGLLDILAVDMMAEDNYTQKTSMSGMNPERFYKHVDIGLHHQYMYNTLQLNQGVDPDSGDPMFSDIAQLAGVSSTDWSWGPLFFDMDNDGHKDIFVSNGIKRDFRNNDFVRYRKKKQEEVIKKQAIETEDFVEDLLSKMPYRSKENYFFLHNGDLSFEKIGLKQPSSNSNGAAYADLDNDGDMDIVVNNSSSTSFIYKNNADKNNNYIKVKLKGPGTNINAIGTKVELYSPKGSQYVENYYTRGFQSAMANDIHFGLGEEKPVDSIVVIWPDGAYQTVKKPEVNKTITLAYEKDKTKNYVYPGQDTAWFTDITEISGVDFVHKENEYNDFLKESLLPHRMSRLGPALTVGDVNGDDLDDFFIGGAKGYEGILFIQNDQGKFSKRNVPFIADKEHEDVGAVFFDADNDGDLDLYVVSGGTEKEPGAPYYEDRLYENRGNGDFVKKPGALPRVVNSGLRVAPCDFDKDGKTDLFVGSRVLPGHYGRFSKSYLLKNISDGKKIKFVDVTEELLPEMESHTMITDAQWGDISGNGYPDLVVANEWGPVEIFVNDGKVFRNETEAYGLNDHLGWWSSIEIKDINNNGTLDIIAGNLGLNYKYKAGFDTPFYMYVHDFDNNNTDDIVLGYEQQDEVFPVRGRQCSSEQMPFIKEKFETYNEFGKANINEIYGEKLNEAVSYKATYFASSMLINEGSGFKFIPFENGVQLSSVNKTLTGDFNKDGIEDILLFGNLHGSEVETPRNDASYGHLLKGNKNDKYTLIPNHITSLWANGDVKDASFIQVGERKAILIARNNGKLSLLKINR